jgi:transposase-like protein
VSEEQEINLSELTEGSPNEEKCRAYLEGLRWPDGVKCPRCGSDKISRIKTRDQLDCDPCRYRFSVTAGTIFHDTHLPLWKWFAAVNLIVESDGEISASEIKCAIGVSYKTAWHLRYRIRDALTEADARLLVSTIEAAVTSVGGGTEGEGRGYRVSDAAVDDDADTETFCAGEWPGQRGTGNPGNEGKTRKNRYKGRGKDAGGDPDSADSSWSLPNPGIGGLPKVSDEHLDALLHALKLYYDRQQNPRAFRDAMRKLLTASNLPYKKLMDNRNG